MRSLEPGPGRVEPPIAAMACDHGPRTDRVELLGVAVDRVDFGQAADRAMSLVRAGLGGWVCTINVAILVLAQESAALRRYVDEAALVVADGAPLVWFSRLRGRPLPERVAGIDLVGELLRRCQREGRRVYFLGATDDTLGALVEWCSRCFPELVIAGSANGYFSDDDAPGRAAAVVAARSDLLFVGMGVPRQERFLLDHAEALAGVVAIGVGGSFDVLAGKRRRAPRWMQARGLEWLFRLVQEPRRLWRRYLVTNLQFVAMAARDLLRR